MAEATTPTKTTARPARVRKAAPAKTTTPAKAEAPTEATAVEATPAATNRRIIDLVEHPQGHTKSYTKWAYPADEDGVTGTVYGPLGASACKVLFVL